MFRYLTFASLLACFVVDAKAQDTDDLAICIPLARASWDGTVAVFDNVLAGKPKWEEAKQDPSGQILELAEGLRRAGECDLLMGLYGPSGMKALVISEGRKDLAAGRRPRAFD